MTTETITTRTAKNWLREDGLVQMVYFPEAYDTLADAQANVAAGFKVGLERRRPVLVDLRPLKGIEREARAYYSSEAAAQAVAALALLVESPVSRVLANFYIALNKPIVPTRMFTSEEAAVTWLMGFIE